MDRVLRNASNVISLTISNGDTLTDADGPVPVSIADSSGTVIATGTATHVSLGIYQFTLTAAMTALMDRYVATWTPTIAGQLNTLTTDFEVVGGFYFTIAEARAFMLNGIAPLASVNAYPASTIVTMRNRVEEDWENYCGVSFVPRGRRSVLDGSARPVLNLSDAPGPSGWQPDGYTIRPRKIVSGTIDGVALTSTDIANIQLYPTGELVRLNGTGPSFWPWGWRNISLLYEHGFDQCPEDVKGACLRLLCKRLVPSSIEDTVTALTNEMGTRSLSTASGALARPFGIPDVDAVAWRRRERVGGFA